MSNINKMKKTELKKLIKSILNEQNGETGGQITQTIPLDSIKTEEEGRELEQLINREFPGGVVDMGSSNRKIKIRIRFLFKWPPQLSITISW